MKIWKKKLSDKSKLSNKNKNIANIRETILNMKYSNK